MLIEYVANGQQRQVRRSVANHLIDRGLARPAYETREIKPETEDVEISARTGKPKRKYRRRDLQAEG